MFRGQLPSPRVSEDLAQISLGVQLVRDAVFLIPGRQTKNGCGWLWATMRYLVNSLKLLDLYRHIMPYLLVMAIFRLG